MSILWGNFDLQKISSREQLFQKEPVPNYKCETEKYFSENVFFYSIVKKENNSKFSPLYHDPQSGFTTIADARIDNRRELYNQLNLNDDLSNISDGCLILRAYQRWREKCVDKLIGDFVFAIWDPHQNQLFLARDPLGQRTLFYSFEPGKNFSFANLALPLLEWSGTSKSFDSTKIANFLTVMFGDAPITFFKSVKRLPAGHFIIVSPNQSEAIPQCYWSAKEVRNTPLLYSNPEEYYLHFQELYQQVIAEQLTHTDKIASQLSGGLDSSSVTCMAAHLLGQQNKSLFAFCHVPTPGLARQPKMNFNYNDIPYMEAVSHQYENVLLKYIHDDGKPLFAYAKELHPWLEQPALNPSNLLWMMVCVEEAKCLGIKTIFCGGGGNFSISWHGPAIMPYASSLSRLRYQLARLKQKLLYENFLGDGWKRPWHFYSAVTDNLAQQTALWPRYRQDDVVPEDIRIKAFDHGVREYGRSLYTAVHFLYGIEFRDPTLDRRIVEFCLRSPPEIFQNQQGSRLLVRKGMGELMPAMIRERTSRGMQAADWYKKIERQKYEIKKTLQSWLNTPVADYIDVHYLLKKFKHWDYQKVATSQGRKYVYYEMEYELKLLRAMEAGLFIQSHLS